MAVGDAYRLSIEALLAGQQIVNVLHYQVTADPTLSASAQALINQFAGQVFPAFAAATHDEYKFVLYRCTRIQPAGPATVIQDFAPGTFGTRSAAGNIALPPNVSASCVKRTNLAGRWARGRIQIAGALATDVTLGEWENAYLALLDTLTDALETALSNGVEEWVPIIYSQQKAGVPVITKTPVTLITAQPQVRVQRSRTVGVGS